MYATLPDGNRWRLLPLLTRPRTGRKAMATLTGVAAPLHLAAKTPKSGEAVIVATNRAGHDALATWRKRRSTQTVFANAKTRGLNFEDTRVCPAMTESPDRL